MFLTTKNNKVIFDYSDINASTLIANPDHRKAMQVIQFFRETSCSWEPTENPQIYKMVFFPEDWATDYGNATRLRLLLGNCEVNAMYLNAIEITPEFEAFLAEHEKRCQELREIEVAKEKERERKAKWESICKYGCSDCKNLRYDIDLPICNACGEELKEINSPDYVGNVYRLFRLIPMPSEHCAFKV